MDIPKEKVKVIVDAYWDGVYKKLLNLDSTTVFIRNVGLITISKFKLRKFIYKFIDKIRFLNKGDNYSEQQKQKLNPLYIKKLRKALFQRNIIAKDYAKKFGNT
jgi:hypothetical protein